MTACHRCSASSVAGWLFSHTAGLNEIFILKSIRRPFVYWNFTKQVTFNTKQPSSILSLPYTVPYGVLSSRLKTMVNFPQRQNSMDENQ